MADPDAHAPSAATRPASARAENAQFTMLNRLRREHTRVDVYLVTGTRLQGRIQSFDGRSMLLHTEGGALLLYHHAVSSVQPSENRPRSHAPGGRPRGASDRGGRGPGFGPGPMSGPGPRRAPPPDQGGREESDAPPGAPSPQRKAPAPVVVTRRRSRISGPPRE